jgi:hypothetical protein
MDLKKIQEKLVTLLNFHTYNSLIILQIKVLRKLFTLLIKKYKNY